MSRSNINLVGNTTQGQNVGLDTGTGVYKGKIQDNRLQFKSLTPTGGSLSISSDDDHIYISAATGGGGGVSWNGSTANGIGTYVDGSTICSSPNLTFDGAVMQFARGADRCITMEAQSDGSSAENDLFILGQERTTSAAQQKAGNIYIRSGLGDLDTPSCGGCLEMCGGVACGGSSSVGGHIIVQGGLGCATGTGSGIGGGVYIRGGAGCVADGGSTGGNLYLCSGQAVGGTAASGCVRISHGTSSRIETSSTGIKLFNLPAKTSETNVVFVGSDGELATGTTSGSGTVTSVAAGNGMTFTTITTTGSVTMGTPGSLSYTSTNAVTTNSHTHAISLDAFAALTSNSSVSWDTSGGLNKTWSINGSYTLTLQNVASGMYGTVQVTVTSGTPTITLAGSGITFKGNGSLAALATGTYMLAWVATSSTTVNWNIATYA